MVQPFTRKAAIIECLTRARETCAEWHETFSSQLALLPRRPGNVSSQPPFARGLVFAGIKPCSVPAAIGAGLGRCSKWRRPARLGLVTQLRGHHFVRAGRHSLGPPKIDVASA